MQLIAHGGAGPLDNIVNLFNLSDVDGISVASLFHYNYLKKNLDSQLKGNNFFLQTFEDTDKKGTNIKDLKNYLKSKNIKVRS